MLQRSRTFENHAKPPRRAVVLPLVLVVVLILGIMVGAYSFRVFADLSSLTASERRLQTRLAAEAGLEKVKLILRDNRNNISQWYNNPDELHRIIVWGEDVEITSIGTDDELPEKTPAFRFSVVADDITDDEKYIRIGLTDEAAKLNLNTATEKQLLTLVTQAMGNDPLQELTPQDIVNAILDWRDTDANPRGELGDTEGLYYADLDPPYKVKNAPFDTVEELLLVKGVTATLLYGEDQDRNGLLTPNEDDGDESWPMDNQDNLLNRGLYPYLTVHSYETNTDDTNRPRVYLFAGEQTLRDELGDYFEDDPAALDYIISVAQKGRPGSGNNNNSNGDNNNNAGDNNQNNDNAEGDNPINSLRGGNNNDDNAEGGGRRRGGRGGRGSGDGGIGGGNRLNDDSGTGDAKSGPRSQVSQEPTDDGPDDGGDDGRDNLDGNGDDNKNDGSADDGSNADDQNNDDQNGEEEGAQEDDSPKGVISPASFCRRGAVEWVTEPEPLSLDYLPILLDVTSTHPPQEREIPGLININTAPAPVLRCIEGLTDEQIDSIIDTRGLLSDEEKQTAAWLVKEDIVPIEEFDEIAGQITARAEQFHVQVLGYSDYDGIVTRLEVILDMTGPLAQVVYYRDISHLGAPFPIRQEDEESSRRVE